MNAAHSVTIYLHGQPGSAAELALFGSQIASNTANWQVLERSVGSEENPQRRWEMLADQARHIAEGRPIRFVGFSLGGWLALHLAALLRDQVSHIDLIACAARPPDGSFPHAMVGKPVFDMARDHPLGFLWMTWGQGAAALFAPDLLRRLLFAKAQGSDVALAKDPPFRRGLKAILQSSLSGSAINYRREVEAFVAAPPPDFAAVRAPITIWHGDLDNWAPISGMDRVQQQLPTIVAFHRLPGLSHYGTLRHALTQLSG